MCATARAESVQYSQYAPHTQSAETADRSSEYDHPTVYIYRIMNISKALVAYLVPYQSRTEQPEHGPRTGGHAHTPVSTQTADELTSIGIGHRTAQDTRVSLWVHSGRS